MKNLKEQLLLVLFLFGFFLLEAQEKPLNLNKPEREEWFTNLGLGMFIHWSFDVQLGMVISHSMVGASDDYLDRYVNELPKTFNPSLFDAREWARAARLAGMKYVVFTTKHHNGFCMYETKTTDFSIMNTPYGKDITKQVVDAFREEGLAIGLYYSPDDFYFLYKQGTLISRERPEALASRNEALNSYAKEQVKELMSNYGKIDILFFDGMEQYAKTELAKMCWEIDPDVVVTRGAIETPEQETPNTAIPSPWEACYTFGDQWQYRPTNENYKSANDVIRKLIEIRAKGGNFLLNFGPDELGRFPQEQKGKLNEISLWMFINQEAFEDTVPFKVTNASNIWFMKKRNENTVYVFLEEEDWVLGERKIFNLKSLKANENTKISVLGHNSLVLEYNPNVDPKPIVKNTDDGIGISVMRAQRIYNDRKWPNPIVVKLENIDF
ncbi:alpha-L-fucosidase [Confluentibacter flavum]|uniref:alpha-L-fucosidase n=1 Tax=Confluentibacter flavum TaxID=1909700 RepID=A0A2N3HGT8_9FLAO|nr:alpha-L-fucosidase [Confluentibacter flavum]PKQ44176.1 alpha-L-fucosidase [Confluentibacter flavum]